MLRLVTIFCCSLLFPIPLNAQLNLDSLREVMQETTDASEKAYLLDELSFQWFYEDLDSSLFYGQLAYKEFSGLDDPDGLARSATSVAVAYHYQYNWDSAEYYYLEALQIREGINSDRVAASLNNLGVMFMDQEEYDTATKYYLRSMEVRQKSNDTLGVALTMSNLGLIFKKQGNYIKALEYYRQAIASLERNRQDRYLEVALLNMGAIYNTQEKYDSALIYNLRLKRLSSERSSQRNLAKSYVNLANTYQGLNMLDSSLYYGDESLSFFKIQNDTLNMANSLLPVAQSYLKLKNYSKVIETCQQLDQLLQVIDNKELAIENELLFAEAYSGLNQTGEAYRHMQKAFELKDLYLTSSLNETISKLTLKYETEQKEREISELKIENQAAIIAEQQAESQRNFLIVITAGLLLSALLLYLLLRTKSRSNSQIRQSLNEKEILLKEIHHRVKNNLQVISSLLSLQSRFIEDKDAQALVNEGQSRVKSMALIHQKLYQKDNLTGVEVRDYIENLCSTLVSTYNINPDRVKVSYAVDDLNLDVDTMIPLGLILNELVSNAFKHAFPTGEGHLHILLHKSQQQLILELSDDGTGADEERIKNKDSFGMRMIHSLSRKLEAEVSFSFDKGTTARLAISNFKLV